MALACAAMLEALDGLALSAAARLTPTQFAIAANACGKSGWLV
jgi:hypothetical protein